MKVCLNLININLASWVKNPVLDSKNPVLALSTMLASSIPLASSTTLLLPSLLILLSTVDIDSLAAKPLVVL